MRPDSISIKWRVFLYLVGFCLLLLGILWLVQTVWLDSFYKSVKLREVKREASAMAQHLRAGDYDAIGRSVSQHGDIYVEVWRKDYGSILMSGNLPDMIQSKLTYGETLALFALTAQNGGSYMQHYRNRDILAAGGRVREGIRYSLLLEDSESGPLLLMVSAGISPVGATVETLRIQLVYISALMLLLSVGLALLIARRVGKPIEKLTSAALELGRGNYEAHFEGSGYREVAQLAATLGHAARELSKTEALRRELIANVSHDLRTPLTLITGYGEMIRDLPGEATPQNMQVIIDEAKRLSSLVGNLLDLSRLQAGTQEMRPARYNLTASAQELIGRFARLCERDGYRFEFFHEGEVFVFADEERISQALYNFLGNAVTYTGPDNLVRVRQIVEGGRVRIEVEDTGEGIAPENLPYIWDRYYRTEAAHRRAVEGAGLGLSIVRAILERHPGVGYGVNSAPGEGSVFWFSLPVAEEG